jgi:acylphosphatase
MKLKLVIEGPEVQDVGYRLFLMEKAKGLSGFDAFNEGGSLIVLLEGEEGSVRRFVEMAKEEAPPPAKVSLVRTEGYDGPVTSLREFREQFNTEQLVKIAVTGVEMKGDIKEMKGDIKEMKGDIKEVLVKQDETIHEIRELRVDLKSWMDERLTKLEKDVGLIKQKMGLG